MKVVSNNYQEYLSRYEKGEVDNVYTGELSVLKVISECHPESPFYVWDVLDNLRSCLLKVEKVQETWRITEGYELEEIIGSIANKFGIKDNLRSTMKWWNLCYFKDKEGTVHYETYYDDKCYVANDGESKMGELRDGFRLCIEGLIHKVDKMMRIPLYVCDVINECNPMVYYLQQNGLEVKAIQLFGLESRADMVEHMAQQRKQLTIPYCNDNRLKIGTFSTNEISYSPAQCLQTYKIALPIGLIDINDKAIGSYTYKDILKKDKLSRDYTCCGHDYCYLEMELFADLYGNTVLKVTNSQGESEYTIINKFENVIMI